MKVTQHQFEEAIRKTGGLYSATVNYIKKKWKVDITRQSVKERAEKMGGSVLIESEVGAGTALAVSIPIVENL